MTNPLTGGVAGGVTGRVSLTRWRYHAAAVDGAMVRGEIDAASERDAVDALRRRSLWVVELTPANTETLPMPGGIARATPFVRRLWPAAQRVRDGELAVAVRAVATLLAAGIPLVRALSHAASDAPHAILRAAFAAVRDAVLRGESLSVAMSAESVFPPTFAPLVAAGEHSGTLDRSLAMLADDLDRRDTVRTQLRAALVYPTILGAASLIGVVVILMVVVPRFAALIADSGGVLPLSTRVLIAVSDLLTQRWWLWLMLAAGAAAAAARWWRDPVRRQQLDERLLGWPLLGGFARTRTAASYLGTLSMALRAGVSLLGAMSLARAVVRNRHLQGRLREAESAVHGGSPVAGALRGLLPPLAERLLEAGEGGGDLAGMADRAATAAEAEMQRLVNQAVSLIEPVMILGFGGVVGFVALALLQAIYGLNASVL